MKMSTETEKPIASIKAYASGEDATSGKIVAKYKSHSSSISAVVFTETEIERMFEDIDLTPRPEFALRIGRRLSRTKFRFNILRRP